MGTNKMYLVFTICMAFGTIGIIAQSQQTLLTQFKNQIRNCLGKHICSTTIEPASTSVVCIDKSLICDGTNNCGDDSDEQACRACMGQHICDSSVTATTTSVSCIDKKLICNNNNDCPNGGTNDEQNCMRCEADEVICRNTYKCAKVCDGIKQCDTGEDEKACPTRCSHGEVLCSDRETCAKTCNAIKECPDNGDELGCPVKCGPAEVLCQDKLTCATPCNGTAECPTNSEDEFECPFQCECGLGEYICLANKKCLPRADVCEGNANDAVATSCSTSNTAGEGDDEEPSESGFKCS